jgi:hypothetical protein
MIGRATYRLIRQCRNRYLTDAARTPRVDAAVAPMSASAMYVDAVDDDAADAVVVDDDDAASAAAAAAMAADLSVRSLRPPYCADISC